MSDRRLDVQWVPKQPDQFVIWGTDLRLYKVGDSSVLQCPGEPLSSLRSAVLQATAVEPHYIKCVDVWGGGDGVVVAAGQANGKISFVTFLDADGDFVRNKELCPRHLRPCTAVAWHPTSNGLLAGGYEKHRLDYGVVVWDVRQARGHDKPLVEVGMGDSCCSVAWFAGASSFAAGINNKTVKLLDTRSPGKPVGTTSSKATAGLAVDPTCEVRLAGHTDNQVVIWDTRNFEKPVVTLSAGRTVNKLAWCPKRAGLLASAGRDSTQVCLHDIMSWATQEDGEPSVTFRTVEPPALEHGSLGNIATFAWHPEKENTLLAVGGVARFREWTIADRLTINWSARHRLVWASGRAKLMFLGPGGSMGGEGGERRDLEEVKDVAMEMEARAKEGYGRGSLKQIGKLSGDPELEMVWTWLDHVSNLVDKDKGMRVLSGVRFPGVRGVLAGVRSEVMYKYWEGLDGGAKVKMWRGEGRDMVLKLCGWRGEAGASSLVDSLSKAGKVSRAAAVAVFNLDLRLALEVLKAGAAEAKGKGDLARANKLNMVCVAVSGYSSEGAMLWKEMVGASLSTLPDPELRALFAFLTAEGDNFSSVLAEVDVPLADRLAFAATYLKDSDLLEYMSDQWAEMVREGRLAGLLLCGGEKDSVDLLQRFVDRTGDVQTATWLVVRCLSQDLSKRDQVTVWVDTYRQLLDQWKMFGARAELDIAMTTTGTTSQPPHQVYVSCHFCGKSISPWHMGMPRGGKTGSLSRQAGAGKQKLQSCPHCRKPLPRCAVCLVNMGTASGTILVNPDVKPDVQNHMKISHFSDWFTWCQTCRHGGHATHLLQWFKEHTDCPVTGCSCKCAQLDNCSSSAKS